MKWMAGQNNVENEKILKQARSFAAELNLEKFSGSHSWLSGFLSRFKEGPVGKKDSISVLSCSRNCLRIKLYIYIHIARFI